MELQSKYITFLKSVTRFTRAKGRPQGCFFVAIFGRKLYNIYESKLSSTYTFFNIFYSILTLKQKDCRTLAVFLFCHFAVAMPAAAPSIKALNSSYKLTIAFATGCFVS